MKLAPRAAAAAAPDIEFALEEEAEPWGNSRAAADATRLTKRAIAIDMPELAADDRLKEAEVVGALPRTTPEPV